MEPNYLFGLTKNLITNSITKQGIIVDSFDVVPTSMGTPCVVIEHPEKMRRTILFPFVSRPGGPLRAMFSDSYNEQAIALKITESPSFLESIHVLDLNRLSKDDIKRSIDYAKKVGPLTLLIKHDSGKELIAELISLVDILTKDFKLNSIINKQYQGNVGLNKGETAVFALTFAGIEHCLPIYDPEKVDGIITYGAGYYPERSKYRDEFVRSCEFIFASSNFKENFTCIDGQNLFIKLSSTDALKKVICGCKDNVSDIVRTINKTEEDVIEVPEPGPEPMPTLSAKYHLDTNTNYYFDTSSYSNSSSGNF